MFAMFAGAAGRAAMFELKARMLADAVPELRGSLTLSLEPLVKEILAWMAANAKGTDEDRETLRRCARLRNKLFHAELSRATGQLVALDVELGREGVRMFAFEGPATAEKVSAAVAAGGEPVAKTATGPTLVFAWLLESSKTGAFGAAARAFDDAAEILERALPGYREHVESSG